MGPFWELKKVLCLLQDPVVHRVPPRKLIMCYCVLYVCKKLLLTLTKYNSRIPWDEVRLGANIITIPC